MGAAVVLLALPGSAPASTTQVMVESGTGTALLNPSAWAVSGTQLPCLTAQTVTTGTPMPGCPSPNDAAGSGAIRLARTSGGHHGGVVYTPTFASADGLKVRFNESMWGGSYDGAIVLWLQDGGSAFSSSFSGSVWYAQQPGLGGIPNLLFGLAIDSWGSLSAHNTYDGNCHGEPGRTPASVALLGSGNSTHGYCYVTGTAANALTTHGATRATGANAIEITVSPSTDSDPRVIVKANGVQIINVPFSATVGPSVAGPSLSSASSYRFGITAAAAAASTKRCGTFRRTRWCRIRRCLRWACRVRRSGRGTVAR